MHANDCFQLGHVIKTHGLNGEVSIFLDTDHPEDYQNLESLFIEINKQLIPFFVESLRVQGSHALIAFEEVETIEDAERLRGCSIYLPLSLLPKLEDNAYYYHELIGFDILDQEKGLIGQLDSIVDVAGNDIMITNFQSIEVMIPMNDDVIEKVDKSAHQILIKLPEGLLDVYLDS